jgi:purine-binding chemotaxis protein CheW
MAYDDPLEDTFLKASELNSDQENRWLLYCLGSELYGSRLLDVKEVIKISPIKSVPFMVNYFKGIINLRGQIVSVIDLRMKFDIQHSPTGKELIILVESHDGIIGAIIDNLDCVAKIDPSDIDSHPAIETRIPAEFFLGIGKMRDRLVNLVDIAKCLNKDEMRVVKKPHRKNGEI